MIFKWLTVPKSNEVKEVAAVQLWNVRWRSRYGAYSGETRPEIEAFTSKEAADEFATSLRRAFRLVRNTSENHVTVEKAK